MEDQSPRRRRPPLGIVMALVAIALSAGSATAWLTWRSISPSLPEAEFPELEIEGEVIPEGFEAPSSEPVTVPDPPETEVAVEPAQRQGLIYWISDQTGVVSLAPVEVELPEGESPADTLALAFDNLMTGPTDSDSETATSETAASEAAISEAATTIPEQTKLLALTVEYDGIHVNLSGDFTTGGGSASMIGRLAQVVYTATTLDPEAPVWISVEGSPLTLLGGEGLEIRQPITRSDVKSDFGVKVPGS